MKEKIETIYPSKEEMIITGEDIEKIREWRREERKKKIRKK